MALKMLMAAAAAAPMIVAHRGASHDAPENTLAAFRLAWQQGADAIEGDFYLTKDGRIVCIHDATTQRTTGTNLSVINSSLEQLRTLDAGSWKGSQWRGEKLPTVEEVLSVVPPGRKILLELKSGPEIVPPLKMALARSGLDADQIVIMSFNAKAVMEAKRQIPGIKVFWLTAFKRQGTSGEWKPSVPDILRTLQSTHADGLDCEAHEQADATLAQALRERNLSLHVWTVDKPEVAARFWRLGAESITTNRPEWLREETERLLAKASEGPSR
jgi:glycerophosphoryl diester phosphodiesterase